MKNSKELNESLNRYRELLGYDAKKGKSLNEKRYHNYTDDTDYAEGDEAEEETEEEGGENADFDFGGEEGGFGDEGTEEEGGEETEEGGFGEEETEEEEGGEDEFGTADEFSAADDIESDEDSDTEEIDVTDIVKRADDAKSFAEKAVTSSEEGKTMIQDLMSKFETLQQSLSKIDSVSDEITSIKKDLQAQKPKEKLELRSLDSYPFNVKLTDYWNDEKLKDNYEITNGSEPDAQTKNGEVKVWKVSPEDTKDYNVTDIKKSFVPESRSKKKILTESEYLKYFEPNMVFHNQKGDEIGKIVSVNIPKFCTSCGAKIKEPESKFCTSCGTKIYHILYHNLENNEEYKFGAKEFFDKLKQMGWKNDEDQTIPNPTQAKSTKETPPQKNSEIEKLYKEYKSLPGADEPHNVAALNQVKKMAQEDPNNAISMFKRLIDNLKD